MTAGEVDGDWSKAGYPVRCDAHKTPMPPGTLFRTEHAAPAPGKPGPRRTRRVCEACALLDTVLGKPITDPRRKP